MKRSARAWASASDSAARASITSSTGRWVATDGPIGDEPLAVGDTDVAAHRAVALLDGLAGVVAAVLLAPERVERADLALRDVGDVDDDVGAQPTRFASLTTGNWSAVSVKKTCATRCGGFGSSAPTARAAAMPSSTSRAVTRGGRRRRRARAGGG